MNDSQLNYDEDSKQMQNDAYRFIFCSHCGKRLESDVKFCSECGSPISANQSKSDVERKHEFAGKIIKCPNCGEILNAFITTCPTCGYELRGAAANSSIKELAAKLEVVDLQQEKSSKKIYPGEISEKERQKIALIRNFPIPNTKEDMMEFLIMAASNAVADFSTQSEGEKALAEAWKAKYEQAYNKAYISFENTREFEELNKRYLAKLKEYEHKKDKHEKESTFFMYFMIILIMIIIIIQRIT